jgi:BON domain
MGGSGAILHGHVVCTAVACMAHPEQHPPIPQPSRGGYADFDESRRYRSPDERERTDNEAIAGFTDDESERPRFNPVPNSRPHAEPRQSFRGRGPRGYSRSDERIREEIAEALTWNEEIDASGIVLTVAEGEVSLSGSVPNRHMKRLAGRTAEAAAGVREVHNALRVEEASSSR